VTATALVERLNAALPQTQCTRCSYADCLHYAQAIADGEAPINQCPPGGTEGITRLSAITGHMVIALNPVNGVEAPRKLAIIDEAWCIGCTLCIKACPVDCIVGAPKVMHTVIESLCTGCELCIPVCPVDCISLEDATPGRSGWAAWSAERAQEARARYATRNARTERERRENDERLAAKASAKLADLESASGIADPAALERKRAVIEAAMKRARERTPT
jgi:Na+-translocating ferredoxin:NAD+ oxidoreductase subunit B